MSIGVARKFGLILLAAGITAPFAGLLFIDNVPAIGFGLMFAGILSTPLALIPLSAALVGNHRYKVAKTCKSMRKFRIVFFAIVASLFAIGILVLTNFRWHPNPSEYSDIFGVAFGLPIILAACFAVVGFRLGVKSKWKPDVQETKS